MPYLFVGAFFCPGKDFFMKKLNKRTRFIAVSAMIAAMYVALSAISAAFGMVSGEIQCRLSEMLCVLPVFTFAAVPGVTIGCFLTNILYGASIFDMIFGTLATLIGALIAYAIRKFPYLASIPTILSNAIIVPIVLICSGLGLTWAQFPLLAFQVAIGEIIACGILGTILVWYLVKHPKTAEILK